MDQPGKVASPARGQLNRKDKVNDWGGRGCNIFVPVLGGNGTKIVPPGDIYDLPPGQMG